jgi:hypothetical protein
MAHPLQRIVFEVHRVLWKRETGRSYFRKEGTVAHPSSHFRADLRAVIGGALAAGFVAAAIAQAVTIPFINETYFTALASIAGGVSAKFLIV